MPGKNSFEVVGDIVIAALQQGKIPAEDPKALGAYFNALYQEIVERPTEGE